MLEDSDLNIQMYNVMPITLIHEYSSTEYYVGVSNGAHDTSKSFWQIKKISKDSNVWKITQFPNGDQNFKYVWDDRLTYTYI